MKAWKAGAAVLLGVVVLAGSAAGDDRKVYKAFHPHWWDTPRYKCFTNKQGWDWCLVGAYELSGYSLGGDGVTLIMDVFVKEGKAGGISITTTIDRKPKSLALSCAGERMRVTSRGRVPVKYPEVRYDYRATPRRVTMDECLKTPLTMELEGREFRLGTKRIQRALEKARDRL